MSDKQHSKSSQKKQPEPPALSPTEEAQFQEQLANYHQIAQQLRESNTTLAIEEALAPLTSLDETIQLALLKALGKERDVDAADLAQALHTMSSQKEVRKEARRTLLRLESVDVYAEWTPPPAPRLSDALSLFEPPAALRHAAGEEDEADEDDEGAMPDPSSDLLSSFESYLSESGLFPGNEYLDTATDFLQSWVEGNFEDAYELLATTSPLREGLTSEEWVAKRQRWADQANPRHFRIVFVSLLEDEEEEQGNPIMQESAPVVDVAWSMELSAIPQEPALPEFPVPTTTFHETGRRWFWTRYVLLEEDGEWFIERQIDEGANVLQLSLDELQERVAKISALVDKRAAELDDEEEEQGRGEDEDRTLFVAPDEDDEDEDEDEELSYLFGQVTDALRATAKTAYYNDARLLHLTNEEELAEAFKESVSYTLVAKDPERSAAYALQFIERLPAWRNEVWPRLGQIYRHIAQQYSDEGNDEEEQRFTVLAEKTLREAIAQTQDAGAYLSLAKLLFGEKRNEDEARALLKQARQLSSDPEEQADIEVGLAYMAVEQGEMEQALAHFQQAAEFDPDYPSISFNIGSLQVELGRYDEAIANLERYIQSDEAPPLTDLSFSALFAAADDTRREEAYVRLAEAHMGKRDLAAARQVLRDALAWDAESAPLLAQLAIVYIEENDLRSAAKYLQRAEQFEEGEEIVQRARALYNERRGQPRLRFSTKQQKPKKKR